jgi:hypothetical protein
MKAALSILIAWIFVSTLGAQEADSAKSESKADTSYVMFGKRQIRIVEKNGETDIKVQNRDEVVEDAPEAESGDVTEESKDDSDNNNDKSDFSWSHNKSGRKFKGHWNAFQLGFNSYLSADKSTSLPSTANFMELNTNKSINVNINMLQQSVALIGSRFGLVTGLGLEFTNYVFENNNTIMKDNNGNLVGYNPGVDMTKSKLSTSYLTVPLLLEFQLPADKRSNRLFINGGVIGGFKLGAHTKYKFKEDGDKQDKKNKNDFNLNALRYGFTGKIGIKHLSLYGIYYPVSLFEKNKSPELYPFMVGFSFDGF